MSGTPITAEQMAPLTSKDVALHALFMLQQKAVNSPDSLLNQLYNVQDSNRAEEHHMGVGGLSDVPAHKGAIMYESFGLGYQTNYTHVPYSKGIAIGREVIDDDEYGVIAKRTQMLGLTFDRTVEKHSVSPFNNAFSASRALADGVALCATNHPRSPDDATTQSNKGASALTEASLSATRKAMRKFTDDKGEVMTINPDVLLVPVDLEETARVIVESSLRSGTANNDANTNRGTRIVVSAYLTDANNWFLIDGGLARLFLNWYWRARPEFATHPASAFDLTERIRGYMRFSYGADTWQWIYGHEVA